jgi:dTDP-4-dehydrorhamnose reductase
MNLNPAPKTILVLGGSGMLGHMLLRVLTPHHDVMGTTSGPYDSTSPLARILERDYWLDLVDVRNWESVESTIATSSPAVVINCVGVIKQKMDASNTTDAIFTNSLVPHKLAQLCDSNNIRFIHFSTDCVFEGTSGLKYVSDTPNATDLYGTTKRLGEISYGQSLTLRTGFVGRQLSGSEGLFEWVRSQKGKTVTGFKSAIYSGLTTMALSRVVRQIIEDHPTLIGLHQVASTPISKFDLITQLNNRLNLGLTITADSNFMCDRSLDGSGFSSMTGIHIPSWDDMLDEFAADQDFYHFN